MYISDVSEVQELQQSPELEESDILNNKSDDGNELPIREEQVEFGSQSDEQEDNEEPITVGLTVSTGDTDLEQDNTDSNYVTTSVDVQTEKSAEVTNSLYVEVGSVLRDQSLSMDQSSINHSTLQPVIFINADGNIPQDLITR